MIKYAQKFDYVSPCWYDLTYKSDHVVLENENLYNETFVKLLKEANPKIKLLPRVYVSGHQSSLLQNIGSFESKFKEIIQFVVKIAQNP